MARRLSPEEAERRRKERSRQRWADMKSGKAYNHFDPKDGIGYGSENQWKAAAGGEGMDSPHQARVKADADLQLLGLTEMPTMALLVRAYRTAARRAHPDSGGSHEAFLKLTQAYDRLKPRVRVQ